MLDTTLNPETLSATELLEVVFSGHEAITDCHKPVRPIVETVVTEVVNNENDNLETVKSFRDRLGLSTSNFTALRRKASRKHPELDFNTVKDSEGNYRVQNADILEALHTPKAVEVEVLEASELPNGGALTISRKAYEVSLPVLGTTRDYSYQVLDTTQVIDLVDSIHSDLEAEKEAERISKLYSYANAAAKDQADRKLIEALIAKGYTAEQAVKIVQGIA